MFKEIVQKYLANLFSYLEEMAMNEKDKEYRQRFNIHPSVRLGYLPHIAFKGNIVIGSGTYFNSGLIITGKNSKIKIGINCYVGYNVCIYSVTHDHKEATGPEESRNIIEKDVVIGDNVWIGNNVVILPGVKVSNYNVIGANAVVTKDVSDYCIVGGVPAKVLG